MQKINGLSIAIVTLLCLTSHAFSEDVPIYTYHVINAYPHDAEAFTQGLIFEGGYLYEGTGIKGSSTLRKVQLETGVVIKALKLPNDLFGEGITIYHNRIIQLTWRSGIGFVYDKDRFNVLRKFRYPTEGWGITHDGKHLIMSDGTATLYFLHPETFKRIGQVTVRDAHGPVPLLNELEYIRGEIYANVWHKTLIARISPQSGKVTGWIDLEGLCRWNGELNGIAYDADNDRLFVTGKFWPVIYEIKLLEKKDRSLKE
ncbi:MAG: glutaminyl-peptide cyclotransferase [Deltaproteobacteria bacterium]|nr:glutaminyl-peptide cyclotransferase [Deltaproteobacteria bacterium]